MSFDCLFIFYVFVSVVFNIWISVFRSISPFVYLCLGPFTFYVFVDRCYVFPFVCLSLLVSIRLCLLVFRSSWRCVRETEADREAGREWHFGVKKLVQREKYVRVKKPMRNKEGGRRPREGTRVEGVTRGERGRIRTRKPKLVRQRKDHRENRQTRKPHKHIHAYTLVSVRSQTWSKENRRETHKQNTFKRWKILKHKYIYADINTNMKTTTFKFLCTDAKIENWKRKKTYTYAY